MDSAITRGHRYSAQNKKTRLATGLLDIDSQQIAIRRLAARADVAVLLPNVRRRSAASIVGNAGDNRSSDCRRNAHHVVHATTLVRTHRQLIAKASRRHAGSSHSSPQSGGDRCTSDHGADGEDLVA
jgi:hypothetical protein